MICTAEEKEYKQISKQGLLAVKMVCSEIARQQELPLLSRPSNKL